MIENHVCDYCENVYPVHQDNDGGPFWAFMSRRGTDEVVTENMVSYRSDPFFEEIRENFTKYWICDDCYYESFLEI